MRSSGFMGSHNLDAKSKRLRPWKHQQHPCAFLYASVLISPLMNVGTTNFDIDETKKIKVGFVKPKYRMASTNLRNVRN